MVQGFLRHLWDGLLEVFFPAGGGCPVCAGGAGGDVCPECAAYFRSFTHLPACRCCGRFMPPAGGSLCDDCRHREWPFVLVRACAPYEGPARTAVLRLKYGRRRALAAAMGEAMAEAARAETVFAGAAVIVPVPLFPARRRERGFNQAELLAQEVGRRLGLPVAPVILKERDTPAQAGLRRAERERNLEGAFRTVNTAGLHGRSVILIDDVFTTGSTLAACAQVLRRAGVAAVYGLTFATGYATPTRPNTSSSLVHTTRAW